MAQKMLMMAVLVILGAKMSTVETANPTCFPRFMSCAPNFYNPTLRLQDNCCDTLRQAVGTELSCICSLFNNPALLSSFNIPIAGALRITSLCGVTDQINGCFPGSPTPAPSPSGNESGDIDKIALTRIIILFLILAYMAL